MEWISVDTIRPEIAGARPGAGRPKTKEDTVVIRVPKSLVPKIKAMIAKHATSQRLK